MVQAKSRKLITTRPTGGTVTEARAFIDEHIRKYKAAIRSLKSARNELAPISILPAEVLSQIFKYVGEPMNEAQGSRLRDDEDLHVSAVSWRELNKVTGICRTWRKAALDCPSLWSRLDFSAYSKPILNEMISRSKASSLSILSKNEISLDTLPHMLVERVLNLERIQQLHLVLPERQMEKTLYGLLGANAARMQSLIIRMPADISHFRLAIPGSLPSFDISGPLLTLPMPHLRYLDIGDYKIDWDSLQSCVSQELISLQLARVSQPSKASFLNLLSRTPNLEHLHLESALPPAFPKRFIKDVHLNRLQSCTIKASNLAQYLDFQTHVTYPSTVAELNLCISRAEMGSFDDDASISRLLSSCGLSVDNAQRSHANLFVANDPSPFIVLWDSPYQPNPGELKPANIPNPAVTLDLTRLEFPPNHETPDVLELLSIPGLNMVGIGGRSRNYAPASYFQFFRRHKNVDEVHIACPSVQSILSALSSPRRKKKPYFPGGQGIQTSRTCSSSIPCLPNLNTLTLEGHEDGETPWEQGCIVEFLEDYHRLYGEGYDICTLNLYRCYGLSEDDVQDCRQDVFVYWDGVCLPKSDDEDEDYDERPDDEELEEEEEEEDDDEDEEDWYCFYCLRDFSNDEDLRSSDDQGPIPVTATT